MGEVPEQHRRDGSPAHQAAGSTSLGFKSFVTVVQTIAGYDVMMMVRKGQVVSVPANDREARSDFIAGLFNAAA
nr:hypothetical protein [Microvirga tunisiensis]